MNYSFKVTACVFILLFTSSCRKQITGNPYIDRKISVSQQQAREEQKLIANQNKAYADQLKENQKNIIKNNDEFFEKKKQYKHLTKGKKRVKKSKDRSQF
ncbi:MAG: hypothetical protein ACT4ON_00795 [Bacteroidota bacterium]